jgi:ribosomal protein L10
MKESTTVEAHLKEMKALTEINWTEEDQVATLLGSLPPSYSTLVTALEAQADEVKLDFV